MMIYNIYILLMTAVLLICVFLLGAVLVKSWYFCEHKMTWAERKLNSLLIFILVLMDEIEEEPVEGEDY